MAAGPPLNPSRILFFLLSFSATAAELAAEVAGGDEVLASPESVPVGPLHPFFLSLGRRGNYGGGHGDRRRRCGESAVGPSPVGSPLLSFSIRLPYPFTCSAQRSTEVKQQQQWWPEGMAVPPLVLSPACASALGWARRRRAVQ